jgi:hypothetical protein
MNPPRPAVTQAERMFQREEDGTENQSAGTASGGVLTNFSGQN